MRCPPCECTINHNGDYLKEVLLINFLTVKEGRLFDSQHSSLCQSEKNIDSPFIGIFVIVLAIQELLKNQLSFFSSSLSSHTVVRIHLSSSSRRREDSSSIKVHLGLRQSKFLQNFYKSARKCVTAIKMQYLFKPALEGCCTTETM